MLRAYTQGRLRRLGKAEEKLESLYQSGQQRILKRLENERVFDFDYHRYERASADDRQKILIEYIGGKFKGDPEISAAQQAFIAESGVTPVALELGLILLQHAQKQTDEKARKSLLDEAESTFLAVNRVAGDRADYQLSLARCITGKGNTSRAARSSTSAHRGQARPEAVASGSQRAPRRRQPLGSTRARGGGVQQISSRRDQERLRCDPRSAGRRSGRAHYLAEAG